MDAQQINSGGNTIETALRLFDGYLPTNTILTIEETNCAYKGAYKYIYRLTYTSERSGRQLTIMAKGDNLALVHDGVFSYYLHQLVLSPQEIRLKFNRIAFFERRAKQEQFLFGGKNTRVGEGFTKDLVGYEEYSQFADFQGNGMNIIKNTGVVA